MKEIYIVEDNDHIRELLEFILIDQDYAVQSFPNARSFQNQITTKHPDLILMDVMLPDGNGLDMCNSLGFNKETSAIPVILMSAHANINKDNCAVDFIPKPFDVDDLIGRIGMQLK
mgnify:FL=1